MNPREILEQARDTFTVRRVFGEPIERDGLVLVPVAAVQGGAGAGGGEGRPSENAPPGSGAGGGWGGSARPVGVYVIDRGQVRWEPAVDVGRIILGAQIVLVVGLLAMRSVLKARSRRG
ncbi:MAG: sporulation protein [Chloroflexi bacterium]|nr:MAG: sporulation protein [Chloroflexota bacterium]